jgi:hypothetical protein
MYGFPHQRGISVCDPDIAWPTTPPTMADAASVKIIGEDLMLALLETCRGCNFIKAFEAERADIYWHDCRSVRRYQSWLHCDAIFTLSFPRASSQDRQLWGKYIGNHLTHGRLLPCIFDPSLDPSSLGKCVYTTASRASRQSYKDEKIPGSSKAVANI